MIIVIKSPTDRREIAGILAENGYTVSIVKVKEGSIIKTAIKAEKEGQQ